MTVLTAFGILHFDVSEGPAVNGVTKCSPTVHTRLAGTGTSAVRDRAVWMSVSPLIVCLIIQDAFQREGVGVCR